MNSSDRVARGPWVHGRRAWVVAGPTVVRASLVQPVLAAVHSILSSGRVPGARWSSPFCGAVGHPSGTLEATADGPRSHGGHGVLGEFDGVGDEVVRPSVGAQGAA